MKRLQHAFLLFLFLSCAFPQCAHKHKTVKRSELYHKLSSIEGVSSIHLMANDYGQEKYIFNFQQLVDFNNPQAGTFEQRIIVTHVDFDAPTIYEINGYSLPISFEETNEILKRFTCNSVKVEHRYYGESIPSEQDYTYLRNRLAAHDLHIIREIMSTVYPGKWGGFGKSKGGQLALSYMTYYPDDLDFCITDCVPLPFQVEDPRFTDYLSKIGTEQDRKQLKEVQRMMLTRKDECLPYFQARTRRAGAEYPMSIEDVYEFEVLEAGLYYWQYHQYLQRYPLPSADSSADKVALFLFIFGNTNELGITLNNPYLIQLYLELGYYGFDTKGLEDLLHIDPKQRIKRLYLPDQLKNTETDNSYTQDIINYLEANDPKLLCLYHEYAPFTAVAVPDKCFEGKKNMHKIIGPKGYHTAGINSLPKEQEEEIWHILEQWIDELK